MAGEIMTDRESLQTELDALSEPDRDLRIQQHERGTNGSSQTHR